MILYGEFKSPYSKDSLGFKIREETGRSHFSKTLLGYGK